MNAVTRTNAMDQPNLHFTRTYAAPRELVFRAWTDAKHLARWWGPHGFTAPDAKVDARPGGVFDVAMRAPDGTRLPAGGEFREVVPHQRIAFTTTARTAEGKVLAETLVTVDLSEQGGRTTIRINARVLQADPSFAENLRWMEAGFDQQLEKLADYLETLTEPVHIAVRIFPAPRDRVWKAWTTPAEIARWWGPASMRNDISEYDLRPGGRWRIVHTPAEGGPEIVFAGTFRAVEAPARLVRTLSLGAETPDGAAVETVTFDEAHGFTQVRIHARFPSMEIRDFALSTGMEAGAAEGYDRLAAHLAASQS